MSSFAKFKDVREKELVEVPAEDIGVQNTFLVCVMNFIITRNTTPPRGPRVGLYVHGSQPVESLLSPKDYTKEDVTTGPTPSSSMIVDPLVLRSSWVVSGELYPKHGPSRGQRK
jgi:hypothetical protein